METFKTLTKYKSRQRREEGKPLLSATCYPPHQTGEYGKRSFLWWVPAQGRSPDKPAGSKNTSDPVSIPLKGVPQATGDKPSTSTEGQSLGDGSAA